MDTFNVLWFIGVLLVFATWFLLSTNHLVFALICFAFAMVIVVCLGVSLAIRCVIENRD